MTTSTETRPAAAETAKYEAVIGLECHVQLATRSKMFCGCPTDYAGSPPNTHVCPICLGMPGVLPVINATAVEYTLKTGLAINATIPEATKFDRKNYPYPDLVKGYQISQYDLPLVKGGWVEIAVDGHTRRIQLERVHLEEDTGKLTHASGGSLVDFNRAGMPLMEMVSQPDLRTAAEARAYLQICAPSCARWASAAPTWKRARCGATSTSRCGRSDRRSSAPRSRSRT